MLESIYNKEIDPLEYPGVEIAYLPEEEEESIENPVFSIMDSPPSKKVVLPKFNLPDVVSALTGSSSTKDTSIAKSTSTRRENLRQFILSFEGGYGNHKADKGGATKMGVTLGTWKTLGYDKNGDGVINAADVKLLTDNDLKYIFNEVWDKCKADLIKDPNIAYMLVDWNWGSGPYGISRARLALGLSPGKKVDDEFIMALNKGNSREIFEKLKKSRIKHFYDIVEKDPSQRVFLKGWLRRVNSINYNSLMGGDNKEKFL